MVVVGMKTLESSYLPPSQRSQSGLSDHDQNFKKKKKMPCEVSARFNFLAARGGSRVNTDPYR